VRFECGEEECGIGVMREALWIEEVGGMGYQKFHSFNIAMLGK